MRVRKWGGEGEMDGEGKKGQVMEKGRMMEKESDGGRE